MSYVVLFFTLLATLVVFVGSFIVLMLAAKKISAKFWEYNDTAETTMFAGAFLVWLSLMTTAYQYLKDISGGSSCM